MAGKRASEASAIATDVVCEHADRCGKIWVSCGDCVRAEACGGCFAEYAEVDYAACRDELREDFAVGFACQALTPDEVALVDDCLVALSEAECATIEEVQDWANGGGGIDPRQAAPGCDTLEQIRFRCYDYSDPEGMVPEPYPG